MSPLMAQGISIGLMLAVWDLLCGAVHLSIYPGIIAWGCFIASGGKTEGLVKTLAALISGAFWALVATTLAGNLGGGRVVTAVIVGLAGVVLVFQSRFSVLSFLGGSLVGVGALFSFPNLLKEGLLNFGGSLIAGVVFGYLSDMLAGRLKKS